MATEQSENIAGVTYDDAASTVTINTALPPWTDFFSTLPALTAGNTEKYDVALLLALEQTLVGKDTDLASPVGRGATPFDGVEFVNVTRQNADGSVTALQGRKQIYAAVYVQPQTTVDPNQAIGD